eukprot:2179357-Prorocentrum_lima.AAC.1
MLEADEKAAENRKSSWIVEEAALGNVAAVEQKGGVKHVDITNINTSYTTPKAPPCRFFIKAGKCRFGEKC